MRRQRWTALAVLAVATALSGCEWPLREAHPSRRVAVTVDADRVRLGGAFTLPADRPAIIEMHNRRDRRVTIHLYQVPDEGVALPQRAASAVPHGSFVLNAGQRRSVVRAFPANTAYIVEAAPASVRSEREGYPRFSVDHG